jgi:hypothetical protein
MQKVCKGSFEEDFELNDDGKTLEDYGNCLCVCVHTMSMNNAKNSHQVYMAFVLDVKAENEYHY